MSDIAPEWHDLEKYPAPEWAKWRAQDSNGTVCNYEEKPKIGKSSSWFSAYRSTIIGVFDVVGNWTESVVSIEELKAKKKQLSSHDNEKSDFVNAVVENKYQRPCKGITIDVYDVLKAFNVTNPAIAHAIKKLLAGGERGHKSLLQDLEEAKQSIERAIELEQK